MDKQKLIMLLIVLAVIVVGVWYILQNKGSDNDAVSSATSEEAGEKLADKLSGFGSFREIMGLGKSAKCTFGSKVEGITSEGTFYYADNKFRVDTEVADENGVMTSHIINDGTKTYTWSESPAGNMAMVMPNEEEVDATLDHDSDFDESGYVTMDEQVEYDCNNWRTEPSKFVPPSDIEFKDMSEMFNQMFEGMPEGFAMPEGMEMPEGIPMPQ